MKKLIDALLNDDHGISEDAYNALLQYLDDVAYSGDFVSPQYVKYIEYVKKADATDGRFYFPE
jgi:hypothetical protein